MSSITRPSSSSSIQTSTGPEYRWARGRRFAFMAEPEPVDRLNIGAVMYTTGHDSFYLRGSFGGGYTRA